MIHFCPCCVPDEPEIIGYDPGTPIFRGRGVGDYRTINLDYRKDADGNLTADISHLSAEEKAELIAALKQVDGE